MSLDFALLSRHRFLSLDCIQTYINELNWNSVCLYQWLPESFLSSVLHRVNWQLLSRGQVLSARFIEQHWDRVDWTLISYHRMNPFSDAFVSRFGFVRIWIWIWTFNWTFNWTLNWNWKVVCFDSGC